jgi:hypothetical protein
MTGVAHLAVAGHRAAGLDHFPRPALTQLVEAFRTRGALDEHLAHTSRS